MSIKISPKQLVALFAEAASDEELDLPFRRFAAKLTVLAAHVDRIDRRIGAIAGAGKALEGTVAELSQHVIALAAGKAPAAPPTEGEDDAAAPGEETAEEMAARVLRETEAEAHALDAAAKPGATVTPLRPNGASEVIDAEPTPEGGAA